MALIGIGWFGAQFFWGFHGASIPLFLKNFTDSKFMISLILSLPGVTGCIIPPIVGYFSDRSFNRFGKRKPYVFFGIIGVFVCILVLPHMPTFGVVVLISGFMYSFLRVAETPYVSLLPDITPPPQRSTASGVMNLFGSIGLITYFFIGSQIWDSNPTIVFYMVAFTIFGFMLTAILLIKEPVVQITKGQEVTGSLKSKIYKYLQGIVEETNVLKFFGAQFFWWLGFQMIASFITLFVVEELKVAEGQSFLVLMTFSLVATLFMLPMGMLGDRFGRKGIISFMLGFWVLSGVSISLAQNLVQALILVGISGIPFAAVTGIGYAYLLDLIPEERTAEFVGLSTISGASAQVFGPLIAGKMIDTMGYRLLFPVAAGFMSIGLVLLQFVRSRRQKKEQT
jgi:MFS family permease